jgi:hypothetical protein
MVMSRKGLSFIRTLKVEIDQRKKNFYNNLLHCFHSEDELSSACISNGDLSPPLGINSSNGTAPVSDDVDSGVGEAALLSAASQPAASQPAVSTPAAEDGRRRSEERISLDNLVLTCQDTDSDADSLR